MKNTMLLLLLLPMALCVQGQITVTLNLPNPCTSVGMDNLDKGRIFNLSVFPNPSDNQFTLSILANEQIGSSKIKMFNSQGVLVYEEEIFSKNQTLIKTVNTKSLSAGLYMISVQRKKNKQTKTIILNKN